MQSCTRTAAISGSYPTLVDVECSIASGFAGLQLVGSSSDLCRDGKERAKTALERLGFRLGQKKIVINLAPADCRKEGNHFDLPIAVSLAILLSERDTHHPASDWLFAAELGLDGSLRPVRAVIPLALMAVEQGMKGLVLSNANRSEIDVLRRLPQWEAAKPTFLFFDHLSEVLAWLFEGVDCNPPHERRADESPANDADFDDMHMSPALQDLAVCAAVGRHNVLLHGSPGSGKSMFAQRLPSLLPRLEPQPHFEVLQLYSLKWERLPDPIIRGVPPIRSPHHSASAQALLGNADEPGDMPLAHGGVLFLDEITEFRRDLLEALREPLETGILHISRAQKKASWHADLQLIAACNPCPCGYHGSKQRSCHCSSQRVLRYLAKISGPLLDRIDIRFAMPEMNARMFLGFPQGQQLRLIDRTRRARAFMLERNARFQVRCNRDLRMDQVLDTDGVQERPEAWLFPLTEGQKLSTRAFLKLMRVARTLADMDESPRLGPRHLNQALSWMTPLVEMIPDFGSGRSS